MLNRISHKMIRYIQQCIQKRFYNIHRIIIWLRQHQPHVRIRLVRRPFRRPHRIHIIRSVCIQLRQQIHHRPIRMPAPIIQWPIKVQNMILAIQLALHPFIAHKALRLPVWLAIAIICMLPIIYNHNCHTAMLNRKRIQARIMITWIIACKMAILMHRMELELQDRRRLFQIWPVIIIFKLPSSWPHLKLDILVINWLWFNDLHSLIRVKRPFQCNWIMSECRRLELVNFIRSFEMYLWIDSDSISLWEEKNVYFNIVFKAGADALFDIISFLTCMYLSLFKTECHD